MRQWTATVATLATADGKTRVRAVRAMHEPAASERHRPSSTPATEPQAAMPLLSVENIEVVYDDVDPGAARRQSRGAQGADRRAARRQRRRQVDHAEGDLRPAQDRGRRGRRAATSCSTASASTASIPEKIVRRGIFQVMEGRRIIADMTVLENLRLGAFTRRDNGDRAATSTWSRLFPAPQGAHRALPAISPAASSRCWRSAAR